MQSDLPVDIAIYQVLFGVDIGSSSACLGEYFSWSSFLLQPC